MKIIIHIGPHKTGSTYLQEKLFLNRELLLEKGIVYPSDASWLADAGHHQVAELDQLDRFIDSVNEKCLNHRDKHSLIISSENFDRWQKDHVKKFVDSVQAPIHVVYFYRKSPSKYYSFWQEKVKHGFGLEFSNFLVEELNNPAQSKIINPSLVLDQWYWGDPKVELSIFDYDQIQESGENLLNVFMNGIFGSTYDLNLSSELINKSLSIDRAELLRVVNQLHRFKGREHFLRLRNAYLKTIKSNSDTPKLFEAINTQIRSFDMDIGFANIHGMSNNFESKYGSHFKTPICQLSSTYKLKLPSSSWTFGNEDLINTFYDQVFDAMKVN